MENFTRHGEDFACRVKDFGCCVVFVLVGHRTCELNAKMVGLAFSAESRLRTSVLPPLAI